MKTNCSHHLAGELKLLKPNLVVFHGSGTKWVVPSEFRKYGLDMKAVEAIPNRSGPPVLYECKALNTHILFLNHPSRGWLDKQWDTVVVPALHNLRSRKLIPSSKPGLVFEEIDTTVGEDLKARSG